MHKPKRIKVTDVNPHLICVLCGGYYIDATTIIECLHSFCRSCIVKYLEKKKYCPICDVQIHKHTPLLNIRNDKTLQTIVYKLVPSLYENEMRRRRQFWAGMSESVCQNLDNEARGLPSESSPIILPEEQVSICLEYKPPKDQLTETPPLGKRYLHCPAAVTVSTLVKFVRGKYSLSQDHSVQIYFKDDLLPATLSLTDLAYTYQWRRKGFMNLNFRILELRPKKTEPKALSNSEWKEVALQISESGVMSVVGINGVATSESRLECSTSPVKKESEERSKLETASSALADQPDNNNIEKSDKIKASKPEEAKHELVLDKKEEPSKANNGKQETVKKIKDAFSNLVRNSELEVVALDKMEANKQRISQAKGEALNRIVSRLSPNERLIGNTSVSIRAVPCESRSPTKTAPPSTSVSTPPVSTTAASAVQPSVLSLLKEGEGGTVVVGNVTVSKETPAPKERDTVPRVSVSLTKEPTMNIVPPSPALLQLPPAPKRLPIPHQPKPKAQTFKYKTLKHPGKMWNPTLDKTTMLSMKQSEPKPPAKFFKARSSANPIFLDGMTADAKSLLSGRNKLPKVPPPYMPKREPYFPLPAHYAPMLFPFPQPPPDLLRSMFPPGLLSLPPPPKPYTSDRTINNNIPPALPAPPPAAPKPPPATPKPAVIS